MESLLTWENLMARARFGSQCSKLMPGRNPFAITGFGPQSVEEAAPGVAAVQVGTPHKTATATSKDNRQHFVAVKLLAYGNRKKTFPPCCLCELLGDPMGNAHTHSLDFCFANPMSRKMIP